MTGKRQKATKVKCKRDESRNKAVKIGGAYSSLEEAFELCWSSFADEHNTLVKSTRRKRKIEQIWMWKPMTTGYIM